MDVTFRIPEIWSNRNSDDIIDDLLMQIAEAGLAEHVVGIQRYRHSIEVQVTPREVTRFLNMDVYVDGCLFYMVADDEPILMVNVTGMKLGTDWREVVKVMSKYGKPVNYYEMKRQWRGKEIKTGVRCVWIKYFDKDNIPVEWKHQCIDKGMKKGERKVRYEVLDDAKVRQRAEKQSKSLADVVFQPVNPAKGFV